MIKFRLGVLIGLACGFALAGIVCKRQRRTTAQPYKVYDQPEVDTLQDEIRNRKLGIRS